MLPSPWTRFAEPDPAREYLVLLTYLPLRRYRTIPRFLVYTRRIARQLESAGGLVGYSLKANPVRRDFWTLSAWEDEAALRAFSYHGEHRDVMLALRDDMGPTRFLRWTVRGSELPPRWDDALTRGDTEERSQAEGAREVRSEEASEGGMTGPTADEGPRPGETLP